MTTEENTADRFRRLAATLTQRVDSVPQDRWDDASPCDGWSARDVLRHVVDSQADFVTKVDLEIPPGPSVDDDPSAAWQHTRDAMQAILDDPAKANRSYDSSFGSSTLAKTVDSFFCFDLVVHGWDIAHATGIDESIAPKDLDFLKSFADGMGDMMRTSGSFGPAVDVPVDADQQTKVLAYLGRTM
ncbi:TIGR03086 family metal-binding protein [Antrihabitans stalactiti]|uniref:TIGR03086 family protein n=1 Tax=Antrihabitans stalactiti TaxID=2584121 RepID=A0A848KQC8_9NOCA|nr:TIGR03086 family metal-binding protein [Antrihabitans stalactiti]NMN98480.1 TIGR03086 family protein [Antrihabitans stalactiti]